MSLKAGAGALCLAVLVGGAPAIATLAPRPGQPVAVLHRSGDTAAILQAAADAGAVFLATRGSHVTFVLSDDPGFARRLQDSGPWIVLDAASLGGCPGSSAPGVPARHAGQDHAKLIAPSFPPETFNG